MKFLPTHDYLAVEVIEEETTPGGIVVPPTAQGGLKTGIVKNAGPGRVEYGCVVKTSARRGMKVVFPAGNYPEVKDDEGKYLLVRETQILGWFEDEPL